MKIIRLKKDFFIKILLRKVYYFLINFIYLFNKKDVYLLLNQKIKIKLNNFLNYKFIYQNNTKVKLINSNLFIYEEEESKKIISNSSKSYIFIDIGSHHGYFSFISSNFFKEVYSVELSKIFLKNQIKISEYNNLSNIKFFNFAIFDGFSKISYSDYIKTYKSQTISLINFLNMYNLNEKKIFLKIDINGFEIPLLNDICKKFKNFDYILIDIYLEFIDKLELRPLLLFLFSKYSNIEVLTHLKNFQNKFSKINKNSIDELLFEKKHNIITLFFSRDFLK